MFDYFRKKSAKAQKFIPVGGARELLNHLPALRQITHATPFDKLPVGERDKLIFIAARIASATKP